MLFMADFEGIMYVETAEGELDQAFVRCPAIQKLNVKTKALSGHGYCVIAVSEGNTVYAEWTCEGDATGCRGEFTLTAGTGKFEGIKGSSALLVRSPLHALPCLPQQPPYAAAAISFRMACETRQGSTKCSRNVARRRSASATPGFMTNRADPYEYYDSVRTASSCALSSAT